jgi:hypothetical protein
VATKARTIKSDKGDTFFLTDRMLQEKDDFLQMPYFTGRYNIHRLFLYDFDNVDFAVWDFRASKLIVSHLGAKVQHGKNSISIGCQTFSGQNYLALRKWALNQ